MRRSRPARQDRATRQLVQRLSQTAETKARSAPSDAPTGAAGTVDEHGTLIRTGILGLTALDQPFYLGGDDPDMPAPKSNFAKEQLPPAWCNQIAKIAVGEVEVDLSAGDVDLEALENYYCRSIRLIGALTAHRNVIVPAEAGWTWLIVNDTTGAYNATVKTSAGTGINVVQTKSAWVRADGTNIKRASADV